MAATSSAGNNVYPTTKVYQPQVSQNDDYLNKAQFDRMTEAVNNKWEVVCQVVVRIPPHETELLNKYKKSEWEGTGFVIGGNFVITNHHVLPRKVAKYATAYFFQVFKENTVKTLVKIVRIAFDWGRYYYASKDNKKKLSQFPNVRPLPADQEHLDFAIVALKQGKDEDLYLHSIQKNVFNIFTPVACEHNPGDFVHIIHHPGVFDSTTLVQGDAKWSSGVLRNICKYFVHYSWMATGGSSGAALMGKEGDLIALHYQFVLQCKEGCQSAVPSSSQEVSQVQEQTVCGCGPKDIVLPTDSGCCSGVMMDRIVDYLSSELNGVKQKDVIEELIREDRVRYSGYLSSHLVQFYLKQSTSIFNLSEAGEWRIDFPVKEIYINLAMIGEAERKDKPEDKLPTFEDKRVSTHESLYEPKFPVRPEELFENKNFKDVTKKLVVLFGVAGVGKTTFCQMAATKELKCWPQFSTVFFIKLRNLTHRTYKDRMEDYSVYEVLAHECGFELRDFEEALNLESFRAQSLIILDGLDELPFEVQSGQGPLKNFFKELLERFGNILITSRPQTVTLPGVCLGSFPEFEITGFDNESIDLYIEKFYHHVENQGKLQSGETAENKIEELRLELKKHPILHSLVHIPFNLTLACSLFNEKVIAFTETFYVTEFYISAVTWLYRKFLLRLDTASQSYSYNLDMDPLLDPRVELVHKTLQVIAWNAMDKNQIQIPESEVNRVLSGNNKAELFTHLRNSGLIKFKNKRWEFIHRTFQEYFAAAYLANLYLDDKCEQAKEHFVKIKFNPRYTLTLGMTAGYLSKYNGEKLKTFFGDLFSEPRDLSISYELRLFAQCFEECNNPIEIQPYFNEIVHNTKQYIHVMPSPSVLFQLFNKNNKLICEDVILEIISSSLNNICLQEKIILTLVELVSNHQVLPEKIIAYLNSLLTLDDMDNPIKINALKVLIDSGKNKGDLSDEIINMILSVIVNPKIRLKDKKYFSETLIYFAKKGKIFKLDFINQLNFMLKNLELSIDLKARLVETIGEIVREGGVISEDTVILLTEMFKNPNYQSIKGSVGIALMFICLKPVKVDIAIIEEIWEMANSGTLNSCSRLFAECKFSQVSRENVNLEDLRQDCDCIEDNNENIYAKEMYLSGLSDVSIEKLIMLIVDVNSYLVVRRVCFLTSRAFVVHKGMIYISDNRQQSKPVLCPSDIDIQNLQSIDRLFDFSPAIDSPTSSLASSSSSNDITPYSSGRDHF